MQNLQSCAAALLYNWAGGRYLYGLKNETMNQKNAIKSMIPQRLLQYIPLPSRDAWADRVVSKFKENNPELYAEMGQWRDIPEEEAESVRNGIFAAAEQIHREIADEA